jgi:hypothetical protein
MVQTSECGRSWDAKNAATGGGHGESHTGGCCHVAAMGIKTPRSWDMEPLQLWWNLSLYSWSCTSKYFQKDPMVYHCQAQGRRQPQMPQAVAETTVVRNPMFSFRVSPKTWMTWRWYQDLPDVIHITVQNVKNRHSITWGAPCLYWWLNGEWWLIIVHDSSPSSQVWISSYFTIACIVVDASSSLNWWIINGEWRCMVVNLFLTVSSNFREMGHP